MKKYFFILLVFFSTFYIFSQSHNSTQAHHASVTQIATLCEKNSYNYSFITAGEDGFLIKWNEENGEHYQVSDIGIKLISCSPNGKYIAVYESDGGSLNKVTVWDWDTLSKKFSKKLPDSVTSIAFSSKGTYLIIGTATIDGNLFVRTSDWKVVDKVKESTSIVTYIKTSDSEKTAVMYSPAGTISYYNIQNGKSTGKFNCVQGLSDITMFSNNLFLAGIKDNVIYIIQATSGKTLQTIPCNNPVMVSSENDDSLYYIEYDGKNSYKLKMVEKINNTTLSNQRIVKELKGPRGEGTITCGKKFLNDIYLGARNGSVFKMSSNVSEETETLINITQNIYAKIYDVESSDENFYFLTPDAIYQSSFDTQKVDKVCDSNGDTSFHVYEDGFIVYSKDTRNPVRYVNPITNDSEVLFIPKQALKSVVPYGDTLVYIESSSSVKTYNFTTKSSVEIFSGIGIQDAVLCNDGKVYIAKSSSTSPASSLISVDTETLETIPLNIPGQVTYGLSTNGETIYGMNLQSDSNGSATFVFSLSTKAKNFTPILKFSEEDPEAITYINDIYLFTNIGKNKMFSYNLSQRKRIAIERTASMPMEVCKNGQKIVILNRDGSISWAQENSTDLLSDWYLTVEGKWYAFK
ncbi:MAG: hypothetical protein HUK25_02355 [Treponema sp.]|nr:hypothetical protein [Treponema sp.]